MNSENFLKRVVVAFVAATMVLGTSCSTNANGIPTPATTPTEESPPKSNTSAETPPPVEDPLDPSGFLTQPCSVLTKSQLGALNITRPGRPTTTGGIAENVGPWCEWPATDLSGGISVGFITNNAEGMAKVYDTRDAFGYFEPTTVDGYPAVLADTVDLRPRGTCTVVVGISDGDTFRASERGSLSAKDACERAKQVASAALATMGEGPR